MLSQETREYCVSPKRTSPWFSMLPRILFYGRCFNTIITISDLKQVSSVRLNSSGSESLKRKKKRWSVCCIFGGNCPTKQLSYKNNFMGVAAAEELLCPLLPQATFGKLLLRVGGPTGMGMWNMEGCRESNPEAGSLACFICLFIYLHACMLSYLIKCG